MRVGYSVLDVVKAFEKETRQKISYKLSERIACDISKCYADLLYAKEILGWEAKKTLEKMCEDSWRWQSKNSNGYKS